jgi:hypothetical protein
MKLIKFIINEIKLFIKLHQKHCVSKETRIYIKQTKRNLNNY